jgi:hypothetical protein
MLNVTPFALAGRMRNPSLRISKPWAGNTGFFSVGAELQEISALDAPSAYEFSKMGQALMSAIDQFPAPVFAAIEG